MISNFGCNHSAWVYWFCPLDKEEYPKHKEDNGYR